MTGPASDRVRLRRRADRGRYDREIIDAILDEARVGYVGWVLDGQPFVTPTSIWRTGDRLYWHASAGSRHVRATSHGEPVCVTAAILDGLVLAKSGANHSMNYRSVMVLGSPTLVDDEGAKAEALDDLIDRLVPGRAATVRPATPTELRQTAVLWIDLSEASAKVRTGGPVDDAADLELAVDSGVIPISLVEGPFRSES